MTTDKATVVVLGGGIGGQVAATRLRQRVDKGSRIVLIERSPSFTFPPSLLWLMTGARSARTITRDYSRLRRRGIEIVQATATLIDHEQAVVQTEAGPIGYDHLVVALGAALDPGRVPGVAELTHNPYTLESAERLRQALNGFAGGRVVVAIASMPYKCPAAPYETAFLIESFLRHRGLRDRSTVDLYTPEPLPLPVAGPFAGHSVAAELARHRIGFHPRVQLERVEEGALHFAGGESAPYDLAVVIPPHRPPEIVAESGLAGPAGWIPVDRSTLRARPANVYAIGDITAIPLENGMMLPKAGVFAHGEAEVVAANIARRIRGDLHEAAFDGHGTCFLESGDGRAGLARGDFYASPVPAVSMYRPGRSWHLGKIAFEQYWLRRWL